MPPLLSWFAAAAAFVFVVALPVEAVAASASLSPYDRRVDNLTAPLGVDSPTPRFSWKLRESSAAVRGSRQTAWQIQVGTSPGSADVWNGTRTSTSDQLNVPFGGRKLRSHESLFWQVRVWDEAGQPSAWTAPATFTMGALTNKDWASATWISDPRLLQWQRQKLGYSSPETTDANTTNWVQLDLGSTQTVTRVRLHPHRHSVVEYFGFPQRFKLEAADEPGFATPRLLADYTTKDYGPPWTPVIDLETPDILARYLRISFPQVRLVQGKGRVAFTQIEVLSGRENIAPRASITANASLEDELWGLASVVDGLGVPRANPRANSTLLVRREFPVRPGLRRALLHVSGLGHYTLHLNGRRAETGLLTPGWTTYDKTILYDTHDVTGQLHPGANALGLQLASGMFNVQPGRYTKFISAFRPLGAIAHLRLEYGDGSVDTVVSDPSWRVAPGPITFSNIFGGEDYDARLEPTGWDQPGYADHSWTPAVAYPGPGGQLRGASQGSPPFRTFEVLKPVASHELRPGVTIYDLGQNASLTLRLRVRGPAGASVKVLPAELLRADGSLNRDTVGNAEASWNYILAGRDEPEEWRPPFFYHGARYLQVECTPATPDGPAPVIELIEGLVTHSDSPPAGEFATSSDLFNRIRLLIRWAQRSNLAHVITDCPHRERLGWLEQYHLNGPALRYEWDLARLYAKGFNDMADAQTPEGLVPDTAPEFVKFGGGFRDSPEWGSAFILAAWQHLTWTGDDAPLHRHYDAMRRYFDYLTTKAKDHLLSHGLGDWYDRGPKPPGPSQLTPIPLTATAIYYEDALTLALIARHLGRDDHAREFTRRAEAIKDAFNRAFLDPTTGTYATGSQTAQALSLVLDLVPTEHRPGALAVLIRDIESRDHAVTAGDVGYRYVLRALAAHSRSDVIFAMNHQSDKPGYGYQLARGATSLTEAWDANPTSSQNHFMLGQIMEWFHGDLAGLKPDPASPGFARVIVQPRPFAGIDWARTRHESPRGPITVSWRRSDTTFTLQVALPPNTTAVVHLPAAGQAMLREGGTPLEGVASARLLRRDAATAVIELTAGTYELTATVP